MVRVWQPKKPEGMDEGSLPSVSDRKEVEYIMVKQLISIVDN